jgi:hypothetical protein
VVAASAGAPAPASRPADADAARARGDIDYLFKAEFGLEYDVEWTEEGGDRYGDCTAWSVDRGESNIVAGSAAYKKGQPDRLAGGLTIFKDYSEKAATWAKGSAVGGARATVSRTLTQEAGTTACGDQGPTTVPPESNDCGTRHYKTLSAAMGPEMRRGFRYLDWATTTFKPKSDTQRAGFVFSISVPPTTGELFRNCLTTGAAPELPYKIPVAIRRVDQKALRHLRPGGKYVVKHGWQGQCTEDLGEQSACHFRLSTNLEIQRWKPGTPFP